MNITRENTGDLTATLKVSIVPEDYNEKVNKLLKDYQKKANIPGFRPGHVPFGMVNKMYGKAIMAEEINKLISDSLTNYIEEEKLQILGNAIPNREKNMGIDFENNSSHDFYFDLGFVPDIQLDLNTFTAGKYTILVDDSMVDRYVESVRERNGTDFLEEDLPEIEKTDELEGNSEETKTESPEIPKPLPKRIPADLTPELFDKVYPGMNIETEEAFRDQIRVEAAAGFNGESDNLFFRQVSDKLVKEIEFPLPDHFLKQWLLETNEGKYTEKEIEEQYPAFISSMRWQLIENKLFKDNNIEVKDEDIRNYIKGYFMKNIPMTLDDPEMEKRYDSLVDTVIQNKEQVRKINDELYTAKLLDLFKSTINIENKEISYDDFIKTATALYGHNHDHEHDQEHEHEHEHNHEHDQEHEHNVEHQNE